ncbi:MAG: hypothetical protein Q8P67_20910, partial [archaeon]|nr:hypothetical protein [archaeon]
MPTFFFAALVTASSRLPPRTFTSTIFTSSVPLSHTATLAPSSSLPSSSTRAFSCPSPVQNLLSFVSFSPSSS